MNLPSLAMKYRPVVFTIAAFLLVWGLITFNKMPRREDPEFTVRTCVVSTQWHGAPAIKVEELITDKLEEALDGIDDVKRLRSTTINGLSTIYVDVEDRVSRNEIQNVWDKVRAKVELVRMPDKDIEPVVNDDFGDTSILVLGLYQVPLEGEKSIDPRVQYTPRQLEDHIDVVKNALRLLPDVAKVEKYGVNEEAIYIETELGTWSQLGLTTASLKHLVDSQNIVSPGGAIDTATGKFSVKPSGEFDAVSEIESIIVSAIQSGDSINEVRLKDLGLDVTRGYSDPRKSYCRFTDERGTFPAIMLGVTMKSGANIIDVCDRCTERVKELIEIDQSLPRDVAVTPVSNQADNVKQKISDVISNVISAIVIVVVVVFLFVGLRTSLVMAANIPIVVLASIAVISLFGVQLEQISLASIIIALGLLVDNAVQVCDQTRTNILKGMNPKDAAIEGANTLAMPMLSGTLTTVAAFFPMLFALEGGGKEYVYSLPVTLSTTLLLSWFLAMTVCVLLASMFIRAPKNPNVPSAPLPWLNLKLNQLIRGSKKQSKTESKNSPTNNNVFLSIYESSVKVALRTKWITAAIAVALLVGIFQLPISSEFFPQDRRDQFYLNVVLPETSTIEKTQKSVAEIESMIRKLGDTTDEDGNKINRLRAMRSMIGTGGSRWALGVDPASPSSNVAEILVRTSAGELTPQFIADIRRVVNEGDDELGIAPIAGARIVPKKLALGPPAAPLVIRITGDGFADMDQLRNIAGQIKDIVRDQPETWDVNDSWGIHGFEADMNIDQSKANVVGVSSADVADSLNSYFSGLRLTTFREGSHQIPVFFRVKPEERQDLSGLDTAFVEGENGKLPLNSVAEVTPRWQPAKIERRDLNRTIEIRSEIIDGASGNDVALRVFGSEAMQKIKDQLPNGYSIVVGGAYEESQDSSQQMINSFGISFLIIVAVLVIQYNGWSRTLVILATLPLAMIGALLGLWLTNNPLGFMPQLGLLSLFGIVLNTGIIFIEFADILIRKKVAQTRGAGPVSGLSYEEIRQCLADAGKQRMLPIVLTTATTVGGLLPLALSGGPLWEGMAWLMIFGLLVATLLTLYIVPALYAILIETFRITPGQE